MYGRYRRVVSAEATIVNNSAFPTGLSMTPSTPLRAISSGHITAC
jgi:hypothetical protein